MNRETKPSMPPTSRHGEFKTPGGKLVVVDFTVVGGRMTGVQITGDFFLYPEEVLNRWNAALEGMEVGCGMNERTAKLNNVLLPTDVLVGVNAEAVATAVERGLAAP
jgi:lipoate-protein ligase A